MKIIILDDSATIRKFIEICLEKLSVKEGEIFSFENGEEALEYIKANGADMIFSDINMPNMSGYEFAYRVFDVSPAFKKSLFIISSDEDGKDFKKMKGMGIYNFIKKPIDIEKFEQIVSPLILKCRARE